MQYHSFYFVRVCVYRLGIHVKWHKQSNFIDVASIQIFNFSVTESLSEILDFPTCFPSKSDQHSSLLNMFLICFPSSWRASQLCPIDNSDQAVVLIDISFEASIKKEPPNHKTYFSYQRTDWDPFLDFIRDALEMIF